MFSTLGDTQTAVVGLLCSLVTLFLLILGAVLYVIALLRPGSRSTPSKKPSPSTEQTPSSVTDARVAAMEADQAALFSTLEKLTTTIKRLSSRAGMRDLREREREDSNEAPPVGASKTELLRHYGFAGKAGPNFARAQQEYETRKKETN